MANWKQELQEQICGIPDLNANTATMTIEIDTLNDFFGGESEVVTITRDLKIQDPRQVNARLVDGVNYIAGDFICNAAFLFLKDAMRTKSGDQVITINGVTKTLEQVRPFTASNNWGIDLGDDTLTIGGDVWSIVGVTGLNWLDNEPSIIEFKLRK